MSFNGLMVYSLGTRYYCGYQLIISCFISLSLFCTGICISVIHSSRITFFINEVSVM